MTNRNFTAELAAAREAGDWVAHERIWEERRGAEVDADEAILGDDDDLIQRAREAVANDPQNAPFEDWCLSVRTGERDHLPEVRQGLAVLTVERERQRYSELLAALTEAEKHFGPFADITINGQHDPEDARVVALMRAAIAKATA